MKRSRPLWYKSSWLEIEIFLTPTSGRQPSTLNRKAPRNLGASLRRCCRYGSRVTRGLFKLVELGSYGVFGVLNPAR